MANELTRQDYDVLIEAMDAWERKDASKQLMSMMAGGLMCKTDQDREAFFEKERIEREKQECAQRVIHERVVMLQSKLISLRDSIDADRFIEESTK